MIRRVVILGAVAVALVVGDVSARAYVEARATERAQLEAPPGSVVTASVGGFPFVPPLLLGGKVSQVGVHLENVTASAVTFATVDLHLRGVELDRNRLIKDRKVRIVDIDRGSIDVVITQQALNDVVPGPVPITIADGALSASFGSVAVRLTPSVSQGRLVFSGPAGRTLPAVSIPKIDYVPCSLGEITILAGRLRLSCEITNVPAALVDAVEDAS